MITLFRRLRQKLLDSGNITRYMLYAVGEILLVVIGILIALQVNNWNEERKLEVEENRVLTALKDDMIKGIENLEYRASYETKNMETLKILLTEGPQKDSLLSHNKIDSLMYGPLWQAVFEVPVLQTYNDLKSSGEVSIIQNLSIRNKLADLELGFNNLTSQLHDVLAVQQLRIDEIAINDLDFITVLQAARFPSVTKRDPNNYREFLNNRKVRNTLGAKLELMASAIEFRQEMIVSSKDLLELIELELKQ